MSYNFDLNRQTLELQEDSIGWRSTTEAYCQPSLVLQNTILKVSLTYEGNYKHIFKASYSETTKTSQRSFAIILEDTIKDDEGGVKSGNFQMDLSTILDGQKDVLIHVYLRFNERTLMELGRVSLSSLK